MSKTNHSPGPWGIGAWTSHGRIIHEHSDKFIAYVQGVPNPPLHLVDMQTAEANVRLIVTAPELLEALERICADAGRMNDLGRTYLPLSVSVHAAEEVIRKAKG